jgi:hypothetical protein
MLATYPWVLYNKTDFYTILSATDQVWKRKPDPSGKRYDKKTQHRLVVASERNKDSLKNTSGRDERKKYAKERRAMRRKRT